MEWGIYTLLFAFFIGPLAKRTISRMGLSALYLIATLFFMNSLLDLESPLYFHLSPQTFALFDLSFVTDPLSLLLSCLITGIGAIIVAYSAYYMDEDDGPRFITLINFFTLSMLGLVLSNNLIGIFIFWEFTSICSYFLISFDGSKEEARRAAGQALLITAMGGLALLCGFLILGGIGESYDLLQIRMPQYHPWLGLATALIFVGVLTKTAQFPFYFWLPNAMSAPSPASAFLHSATMVKAGIFVLFRLSPLISEHPYWKSILMPAGLITALLASLLILFEKDLKRILAYTTISSLGLIIFALSKNTAESYYLAVLWIFAHALYKAPLFLLAGNIEHFSGSRDVTELSQLYPRMKGSLIVAVLGAASILGIPPLLSFHVKEEFFNFYGSSAWEFASLIFIFASAGSVGFTIVYNFLKDSKESNKIGKYFDDIDDPALLWLPPLAALIAPIMIGLKFDAFSEYIKDNLGQTIPLDFEAMTVADDKKIGIIASAAIFFLAIFFAAVAQSLRKKKKLNFGWDRIWHFSFNGFLKLSQGLFSRIQNGRLDLYCIAFFSTLIFLLLPIIAGFEAAAPIIPSHFQDITPFEIALIASIIISCFMALKTESNLSALVVLGIVGFGIAFIYVVNAAPDLALTQFLIEVLTLLLVVLCFKHLPKKSYAPTSSINKLLTVIVAATIGICVGVVTFFASAAVRPQTLSTYFGEKSLALAHGKNVVNVAIVDFRGFDTLGEITVLTLAAVGVITLIRRSKEKSQS